MARRLVATAAMASFIHTNCRSSQSTRYCKENQLRQAVPDNKVPWSVEFPEYKPDDYTTSEVLKGPVWADPNIR